MEARDLVRLRKMAENGAARAIREAAGLSLSELARGADLHRSTVFRYEAGLRRPCGAAAERYLRALEEIS